NKIKDQASLIKRLSEELAKVLHENLETHRLKGYTVSTYEAFDEVAYSLVKYFQTDLLICKTSEGYLFASKGIDCSKLIESLRKELPGTGGGGVRRGTFKTPATLKEILLITEKFLEVI
ncbi:MAG: alanyl-tRNA editing protein, partial [Pseudothermotoga sp.]